MIAFRAAPARLLAFSGAAQQRPSATLSAGAASDPRVTFLLKALYWYFILERQVFADSQNPRIKTQNGRGRENLFAVPGPEPQPCFERDVGYHRNPPSRYPV